MPRFLSIDSQFFDANGQPLSGGMLSFFDSGTMNAKDTYSDEEETIPNTNPVVLDAAGVPPDIWFSGTAKVVLYDQYVVQIREMDPVSGG